MPETIHDSVINDFRIRVDASLLKFRGTDPGTCGYISYAT